MIRLFSIALLSILLSTAATGQAPVAQIAELGWMAGCWEINEPEKKRLVSEQWMKPAGGTMIGMARTVRNGKTVIFEFTRLEQRPDGIFYVAKPSRNKDETSFKLIRSGANEAVFENAQHDFPQRIIYKRDRTKLSARIEGNNSGKFLGIDYPFTRVSCE